ncbi:MAG: hypothetical protein Q4B42_03410 [Oscillospiraceae bacterium]|nr:hypothetical protein [Oscillospiraceae bacterium]
MLKAENEKKAHVRLLPQALILLAAAALLLRPETGARGVLSGLSACYKNLIPALFPFLFLTDALRSLLSGGSRRLETASAVFLSFAGGFPMGARALCGCVQSGALSRKQASLLLCGAVNAGPAFLISGVGLSMFGSESAGLLLFVSLTLASLLTPVVMRLFSRGASRPASKLKRGNPAASPPRRIEGYSLSASLEFAVRAILNLCGYVVLFSCLSAYLEEGLAALGASAAQRALSLAFVEVTKACLAAGEIGSLRGLGLACLAVSLCGGCMAAQIADICREARISIKPFLLSRPAHLLLSQLILRILLALLPQSALLTLAAPQSVSAFSVSAPCAAALLASSLVFLLGEKRLSVFTKA